MKLHHFPFVFSQQSRLVQDFQRSFSFAQVVEKSGQTQVNQFSSAQAEPPAGSNGQQADVD